MSKELTVGAGLAAATLAYLGLRAAGITNKVAGVAVPTLSALGAGFAAHRWSTRGQLPVAWTGESIKAKVGQAGDDFVSLENVTLYCKGTKGCDKLSDGLLAMKIMGCKTLGQIKDVQKIRKYLAWNVPVALEWQEKTHVIVAADKEGCYAFDPTVADPKASPLVKITDTQLSSDQAIIYTAMYDCKPFTWTARDIERRTGSDYEVEQCLQSVTLSIGTTQGYEEVRDVRALAEKMLGNEIEQIGHKEDRAAAIRRCLEAQEPVVAYLYQRGLYIVVAQGKRLVHPHDDLFFAVRFDEAGDPKDISLEEVRGGDLTNATFYIKKRPPIRINAEQLAGASIGRSFWAKPFDLIADGDLSSFENGDYNKDPKIDLSLKQRPLLAKFGEQSFLIVGQTDEHYVLVDAEGKVTKAKIDHNLKDSRLAEFSNGQHYMLQALSDGDNYYTFQKAGE